MARRKTQKPLTAFEMQCRFNSGYHAAALAIQEGWNTPERNFGFGPALTIRKPSDVLDQHFSKLFAIGWTAGYLDVSAGKYTGNSQLAWEASDLAGVTVYPESK